MKKVKFIKEYNTKQDLTLGKIYDVNESFTGLGILNDRLGILDDKGVKRVYSIYFGKDIYFEDATIEVRNEVIDEILN